MRNQKYISKSKIKDNKEQGNLLQVRPRNGVGGDKKMCCSQYMYQLHTMNVIITANRLIKIKK